MPRSIATRTFRIVLYSTLTSLFISLGFAWWALETLESTMLDAEARIEIEYFDKYGEKNKPFRINTAQMISTYLPDGTEDETELPIVFQNVSIPFQGEIEVLDTDYMVVTHAFPEGKFYLAKNIQPVEERESGFLVTVIILSTMTCMLAFGLAKLAGRNISGPVVRLTTKIRNLKTESTETRMNTDYPDSELNEIARAMNHYLNNMEGSLKRERSLITMASHELKTPVAVVLGAARVIEARGKLGKDDAVTLNRIIDAANEMSANIHGLLNLARRSKDITTVQFRWSELLQSIQQDYQIQDPRLANRLKVICMEASEDKITTDRVLVKMLLHNLIGNALNYTEGDVGVELYRNCQIVADEGIATTDNIQPSSQPWQTSGLGLYIIDLLCKQLGWRYEIIPNPRGSCVRIWFGQKETE